MTSSGNNNGRWKPGLFGAALAGFAGLILTLTPLGDGLAHLSCDLLFHLRPAITPHGVVLVYLDEPSAKELHQPFEGAAWDRTVHAQLIHQLVHGRARAIVFDILFDLPGTNDQPFLHALAAARSAGVPVIVGAKIEDSARRADYRDIGVPYTPPFPALREVADWGLVLHEKSRTRVIRRHVRDPQSLARRVAQAAGATTLPDPSAECWLNYYGPPDTLTPISYSRFLDTNLTSALQFSNQLVFIGEWSEVNYPGGRETDLWPTPFTRWNHGKSTGTEINATACLNFVRGDWLKRWPPWAEAILVLGTGTVLGLGLARWRPLGATGVGLAVAACTGAAALWAMGQQRLWFPWLFIAGVQVPLALGWACLDHTRRLSRERDLLQGMVALLQPALAFAGINASPRVSQTAATARAGPSQVSDGAAGAQGTVAIPDHSMLRCVGRGAYGEVWLARNAVGLFHAVKVVHRSAFNSEEPFEREFRGIHRFMPVSRLHPGLVQILHVGRDDSSGWLYYVMEAGDDETTGQQIQVETYSPNNLAKEIRRHGRLPGAQCVEVSLALTAALDFLHSQQLIHRDIKPSNIIFVRGQPKFTDIGLVAQIATESTEVSYLGTQGYIAPEGPGRPPADIFSLGRVLYEAWSGLSCACYPQLPDDILQWPDRDLALALNEIVIKACQPDTAQRYASAQLMKCDLQRLR